MTEHEYAQLAPGDITFPAGRQRTEIKLDDGFLSSIRTRGILLPLLVTRSGVLVCGGRRLTAALQLGLTSVPVCYVSAELPPTELRIIELEENVRRADLPWRDQCRALADIHKIWSTTRENWRMEDSERELAWHNLPKWLRVYRELDNPRLANATNFSSAYNICERIDDRNAEKLLEDISYVGSERESAITPASATPSAEMGEPDRLPRGSSPTAERRDGGPSTPPAVVVPPPNEDIQHVDFIEWARTYSGPRFNFIHCDFPYGKRVFAGQWGGKDDPGFQYNDDPDTYWLLLAALCESLERIATPSAHLMFWLSSEVEMQHATISRFRELAPSFIFQPRALVWLKSDNVGIVPDPKRGPRWITELALMATRGDRTLVRPLGNAYAAPTARQLHPSTKPEPVLRHFFGMFVDGTTRMLDPTAGSGSALRAAESLGAESVLGLERDEQYVRAARKALREFRALRELTG